MELCALEKALADVYGVMLEMVIGDGRAPSSKETGCDLAVVVDKMAMLQKEQAKSQSHVLIQAILFRMKSAWLGACLHTLPPL